jgi:hypothetical protein
VTIKTAPDTVGQLPTGIYRLKNGTFEVRVSIGSGKHRINAKPKYYPAGTSIATMVKWQEQERDRLEASRPARAQSGTMAAEVEKYFTLATDLTTDNRKRRTQQLAWWCAQPAALGAPVFTVDEVSAGKAAARGRGLGDCPLRPVNLPRIREILKKVFAPTDPEIDDTEFASTSNSYRTALVHLFTILDQDDETAVNPMSKVPTRAIASASLAGQDMRIIREILKYLPSRFGRSSAVSVARIMVLAYVHITPKQLMALDPRKDFIDVPDADRADMINGLITVTKRPRRKGRQKTIPPPETIPTTPYGVEALRVFAACPDAWGIHPVTGKYRGFSTSPLNKMIQRAAALAQAAFLKRGIEVDLSGFTLYHLKHSLASAASIASAGAVDRRWQVQQSEGVQRALDHKFGSTTAIYTRSAVAPILLQVNAQLSTYLDDLFRRPLTPRRLTLLPTVAVRD